MESYEQHCDQREPKKDSVGEEPIKVDEQGAGDVCPESESLGKASSR